MLKKFFINAGIRGANGVFLLVQIQLILEQSTPEISAAFIFAVTILLLLAPLTQFGENFRLVSRLAKCEGEKAALGEYRKSLVVTLIFSSALLSLMYFCSYANDRLAEIIKEKYFWSWAFLYFFNSHLSLYLRGRNSFAASNLFAGFIPNIGMVLLLFFFSGDSKTLSELFLFASFGCLPGFVIGLFLLTLSWRGQEDEKFNLLSIIQDVWFNGAKFFMLTFNGGLILGYPQIMSGLFFSDKLVIVFGILSRFLTLGLLPYNTVSTIIPTIVAKLYEVGKIKELSHEIRFYNLVAIIFSSIVFVPLIFNGIWFVELFFDFSASEYSAWIYMLPIITLISVGLGPVGIIMGIVGNENIALKVQAVCVALFIPLSLLGKSDENFILFISAYSLILLGSKFFQVCYLRMKNEIKIYG